MFNFFVENSKRQKEKGNGFRFSPTDGDNVAKTITTRAGSRMDDNYVYQKSVKVREATKRGYAEAAVGDSINLEHPNSKTRRGRVGKGVAQTLTTSCNQAVVNGPHDESIVIRKLTPSECYKLMGFDAEDCRKCSESGVSNAQLYKQAGNSIVVNVLEAIFSKLSETYKEFESV